jgi:hypothetical protein
MTTSISLFMSPLFLYLEMPGHKRERQPVSTSLAAQGGAEGGEIAPSAPLLSAACASQTPRGSVAPERGPVCLSDAPER